ncbi:MAG: hypothetical protein K8T26_19745 [Lentisphaerae bacterium]|nr:hypothetical protein [Lentisphaerota bacterium]
MNRTTWVATVAGVLLVALAVTARDRRVLSPESYGAVKFGSRLSDIENRLGCQADPPERERDADCDFVTFATYPEVHFMVEAGIVTRADALDDTVSNSLGITVGTSFEDVRRRFPSVVIEEHVYADGHYLIFRSRNGKRALLFEEVEGKITCVRGGLEPSVEYVEGCL